MRASISTPHPTRTSSCRAAELAFNEVRQRRPERSGRRSLMGVVRELAGGLAAGLTLIRVRVSPATGTALPSTILGATIPLPFGSAAHGSTMVLGACGSVEQHAALRLDVHRRRTRHAHRLDRCAGRAGDVALGTDRQRPAGALDKSAGRSSPARVAGGHGASALRSGRAGLTIQVGEPAAFDDPAPAAVPVAETSSANCTAPCSRARGADGG
jgi:hypothetical protein